jgi:sensor histidine kinase regulating citrate/malate metabolism
MSPKAPCSLEQNPPDSDGFEFPLRGKFFSFIVNSCGCFLPDCKSAGCFCDGGRAAENGVPAEGSGLGLIGIRERVMALGGTLDVIDLGDKGFKLHAMIPFEALAEPPQ